MTLASEKQLPTPLTTVPLSVRGWLAQPKEQVASAPGIFGYSNITMRQRDIEKAKQLLSDAGFPNGFDIIYFNIDNLNRRKTAEVIKTSLSEMELTSPLKDLTGNPWWTSTLQWSMKWA